MTQQTTAERLAVWIGRVISVLAVAYTGLAAWVLLGRPTSVGSNGYLLGSFVSLLLVAAVAYELSDWAPNTERRRRSF